MSEFVDSPSAASAAGTRVRALRDFFLGKGWDVQLIVPMEGIKSEGSALSNGGVLRLRTYETHRQQLQSPAAALLLPLTLGAYLAAFRTLLERYLSEVDALEAHERDGSAPGATK